jgi:hypothetical protein
VVACAIFAVGASATAFGAAAFPHGCGAELARIGRVVVRSVGAADEPLTLFVSLRDSVPWGLAEASLVLRTFSPRACLVVASVRVREPSAPMYAVHSSACVTGLAVCMIANGISGARAWRGVVGDGVVSWVMAWCRG